MFNRACLPLIAALVLALPVVTHADLNTTFVYPGVSCRYYDYAGDDVYFRPNGLAANGLRNTSGSSRNLTCPIVAIAFEDDAPVNPIRESAGAVAAISSSAAVCALFKRSVIGSSWASFGTTTITAYNDGIWLHQMTPTTYYATANHSLSLHCSIPSNAYISGYWHASWNHD